MRQPRSGAVERLLWSCVGLFAAALLLAETVHLLVAIRWWLIGGVGGVALVGGAGLLLRRSRERW